MEGGGGVEGEGGWGLGMGGVWGGGWGWVRMCRGMKRGGWRCGWGDFGGWWCGGGMGGGVGVDVPVRWGKGISPRWDKWREQRKRGKRFRLQKSKLRYLV